MTKWLMLAGGIMLAGCATTRVVAPQHHRTSPSITEHHRPHPHPRPHRQMTPWGATLAAEQTTDYYGEQGQYLGSSVQTGNRTDFYGPTGDYRGEAVLMGDE